MPLPYGLREQGLDEKIPDGVLPPFAVDAFTRNSRGNFLNKPDINETAFILLLSVFAGSITIASVLANKIISVAGFYVPAGVLAFSVTFICTDVISEK
jgi:hypothetical protein